MKDFWEEQSLKKVEFIHSISNLSKDQDFSKEKSENEILKIENYFNQLKKIFNSCIEIGAGTCQWTPILTKYSKNVLATDTSISMLKKGKEYVEKKYNSKGISFFGGDILKEKLLFDHFHSYLIYLRLRLYIFHLHRYLFLCPRNHLDNK